MNMLSDDTDTLIMEIPTVTKTMTKVYVVTEEYYGGEDKIKLFDNEDEAEIYAKSINQNESLDIVILLRVIC